MDNINPKFVDIGHGQVLVVLTQAEFKRLCQMASEAKESLPDKPTSELPEAPMEVSASVHLPEEVRSRLVRGDGLIRALRKWRGITQLHLAFKANITQSYLSDLETGHRTGTSETLSLIARALEVEAAWLLGRENDAD
jgi:ribosome-binding protein aMBF1 (putative translation factor)